MIVPEEVAAVAKAVQAAGGVAYLVGGSVVDHLLGVQPKDWDIEVYNLELPVLRDVLSPFNPKLVGESFGVLKVGREEDIDVSVPRRDNRIGAGHKDFEVTLDPYMPPREAARRRDLTINSMLYDFIQDVLIDPFGGKQDLEDGILRATDPKTFVEDPLRVLRIMQLLPRKASYVDSGTTVLCASIRDQFHTLSRERVFEEFAKLLLKAVYPSEGLNFLLMCGWVEHFPELLDLVKCRQNEEWHPEGDVWEHTMCVVDNAALLLSYIPEDWRLAFMFGALCHDLGKPSTTDENDNFSTKGHDKAGEPLAEAFMRRLTNETELINRVKALTRNHMQTYFLTSGNAKASAWRRLHNKVRLDVLGFLSLADRAAAVPEILGNPHDRALNAWKYFEEFGATGAPIKPKLLGRHLIERGYEPGPAFGPVLKRAYELQLDDDTLTIEELYERSK